METKAIKKFGTWSSGNADIDKIIQESQINNPAYNLRWMPYDNFHDTKHIDDNKYYTLHSAKLLDKRGCEYEHYGVVTLKELKDYRYDILEFFKMIKKVIDDDSLCFIKFFGISKNPSTQNYIIVMESHDGIFHSYLSDIFLNIMWCSKIEMLHQVIDGLKTLHENNLVHCDLNSRNIPMKHLDPFSRKLFAAMDPEFFNADLKRNGMNKSHKQKLLRSLYKFHPESCYVSRNIYTLFELQDSLEDIKSGKYPNLCLKPIT
ncbi:1188_t:CDS:2 [Diversispora eburnea]|uniref:1188_t:CDS:1 n=1 Tax=Diversispora eburnea TaxID=1213867 RepID=A0A9N9CCN0_9GLOM|nr:1188_t:CDS:2 [Diversispora eburnea]